MKYLKILLFSIFLFSLVQKSGLCDFKFTGAGARPAVFGNSYAAISDDTYGIYYNPGGLAFARCPQVSAEYGKLWTGLTDESSLSSGFIGGIYPFGGITGTFGCAMENFSLSGYYSESNLDIAYSRKFAQSLGVGIGLKQLRQGYVMDEYTLASGEDVFRQGGKTDKTVTGLDFGILWNLSGGLFVGASLINANQPDVGFNETESLPSLLNFAVAYRSAGANSLNIAFGMTTGEGTKTMAAVEKWFSRNLWALRCGFGTGSQQYSSMSLGASVALKQAQIDYAYILPNSSIKGISGNQKITLTYSFGSQVVMVEEVERKKIIEPYEVRIKDMEGKISVLEGQLKEAQQKRTQEEENAVNERINAIKEELRKNQQKMESELKGRQKPSQPVVPEREKTGQRTHVVKSGESLPSIAQEYYGDSSRWKLIFDANKNKIERGQIVPGQVLVIP